MRPKHTSSVPWRVVDGRAVIVQPGAGRVHELNEVGTYLWSQADGSRELTTLARGISESFEIDEASAVRDATEFYTTLQRLGLITL